MHERALENWLDNAGERAFQIPFSHSLAAEGYKVVHVSRHCAMELGKDILAIAPDGTPCAFQLKGVKGKQLTLSEWREDLERQLNALVFHTIIHPSIPTKPHHQAYIVINGLLSEEVSASIVAFNMGLPEGYPKLKTILRGDLLEKFKTLGSDFWPEEVSLGFKTILELLLTTGQGTLDKFKLSQLLDIVLESANDENKKTEKKHRATLAAAAILTSYVSSSFVRENNHVAEFEALTVLYAHLSAYLERNSLQEHTGQELLNTVSRSMFNCLARLCDELISLPSLRVGDPLVDRFLFQERVTYVSGLMAMYGLFGRVPGSTIPQEHSEFINQFVSSNLRDLRFNRESSAPSFFFTFLLLRLVDVTRKPDYILVAILNRICTANHPDSKNALPSPYFDAESVFEHRLGTETIAEDFSGSSYTLEAFWLLLIRSNLKQTAKALWPQVSRIDFRSFEPTPNWRAAQWISREGTNRTQQQPLSRAWTDVERSAYDTSANGMGIFRQNLAEFMAFVIVYPHRFTTNAARVISDAFDFGWRR